MTLEERRLHLLTEMTRSLAYAVDLLAVEHPSGHALDDAFAEVFVCFSYLRYFLSQRLNSKIGLPQMSETARFGRILPMLEERINEMLPVEG